MKAYSNDFRKKIISAYIEREGSYRELALKFGVSLSFIQTLINRYQDLGRIEPLPRGGNKKAKINDRHSEILQKIVRDNNDATLEELCVLFELKTQIKVSRATMGRILQKLQLTRKKTLHASEQDTERVQKLRQEFWEIIRTIDINNLVFIDESGVNIAMTRLYARALTGKRSHGARPDKRGKNVTIIGAIALRGMVGAMTFKGGTDTLAFQTYIKEVLVPNMTVRSLCSYG